MFPIRDTNPSSTTPFVTYAIIAVNLVIFLFEFMLGPYREEAFIFRYGLVPDRFHFANVLTSMFLHGGWMHVLGNMWFLWIFGDNIEDILGHGKYLLFYLICGCAAAFTQVLFNPYSRVPMVGASGAIAGVMGAYLIKFPQARIRSLLFVLLFITFIDVPAWLMLIYWFGIQFLSGFESLGSAQVAQGGTAFFAHIGGFIAGIVLVNLLGTTQRRYRRSREYYW
jgi:membrane associated rhomboid family serine protease